MARLRAIRRFSASLWLAVAVALVPLPGARAQVDEDTARKAGFDAYLQQLAAHARAQGVRAATIDSVLAGLTPDPAVVELDRAQPEMNPAAAPPDFAPYLRAHVDAARIAEGRALYGEVRPYLPGIEARYGVPASIILSIWGNETNYGRYTGNFDLARSIATLAWEGRRRELFAGEFIALLKMVDEGVPRARLKGSWAGAFGNPQFLPSTYLRLAQDGDSDGVRDIWSDKPDTMASIANYLRDAGWRPGEPWGVRAMVPENLDRAGLASTLVAPSCTRVEARRSRWLTVGEWRKLGVTPEAPIGDDVLAALLEPDGPGKSAFLLTGNYRVILEYNCSNFYALSVGLLADEIAG
ncbi:MAG: lytic murein transglycosylase [Sphingomonadales bacterium]|nr:lytic murein transglycosylase [Sphingomonadales bacterium]